MLNLHRRSSLRAAIAGPVILLALAACGGGSDSTATPAASATGAPNAEGAPGAAGGGGGMGGVDFTAIQACLKAAGIEVATPSDRPSAGASQMPRPSGTFNGTPPSGAARPSGGSGFGGGGGGMFQSKEAQAALKACGITIPTGRGNRPTATPTS